MSSSKINLLSLLALVLLSGCLQQSGEDLHKEASLQKNSQETLEISPHTKGLEKGYEAAIHAQSAESLSEWNLVRDTWNEAISHLKKTKIGSTEYENSQKKILEYMGNRDYAQERIDTLTILSEKLTNPIRFLGKDISVVAKEMNISIKSNTQAASSSSLPKSTLEVEDETGRLFMKSSYDESIYVSSVDVTIKVLPRDCENGSEHSYKARRAIKVAGIDTSKLLEIGFRKERVEGVAPLSNVPAYKTEDGVVITSYCESSTEGFYQISVYCDASSICR